MYRFAFQPARALSQTLSTFMSQLRSLDKRTRWTSATTATFPASVSLTEAVSAQVATLTVDPGRWLILGGANLDHIDPVANNYFVQLTLSGLSAGLSASRRDVGSSPDTTTTSLQVVQSALLSAQTTLTLSAYWDVLAGSGTECTANDIYLIATPA
jgi:hypothetical protein